MHELLARLVEIPTVSDNIAANNQALGIIQTYLEERGMYVKRHTFDDHSSIIATVNLNAKKTKVILYGHVDVAPAEMKRCSLCVK